MISDKVKRVAAVVFLTVVIWTWAYLALEENINESCTLNITTARPDALVTFVEKKAPVPVTMTLKGSTSMIAAFNGQLLAEQTDGKKGRLEFSYNAETENQFDAGVHQLNVLSFLKKNFRVRRLGLTVDSCEPEFVEVKVEKLEEKWLDVQCVDENFSVIEHENVEPSQVKMFVRTEYQGQAVVTLTAAQISKARMVSITGTPYVNLSADGKNRRASKAQVKIKLPSTRESMQDRPLQPTIGYSASKNIMDKYSVELLNESELTTTNFKATDEAWAAYDDTTTYQLLIEIRDSDPGDTEIPRKVIYNFPPEYVAKGEIRLTGVVPEAIFKLIPKPSNKNQP